LLPRRVCMASGKQEHIEQITEKCLIAQKKFSFKEWAERDWKYCCKRRVNRQFSARSAWVFVFNLCYENYFTESSRLTCNKQLTSQKVLCMGLNSLVVCVKSPHSLVPCSFGFLTQTTRAYNPIHRTFYDVNYIYWFGVKILYLYKWIHEICVFELWIDMNFQCDPCSYEY